MVISKECKKQEWLKQYTHGNPLQRGQQEDQRYAGRMMLKRIFRGWKCQIGRPLSRIEEDRKKWLRRPKLCTKSCRAVLNIMLIFRRTNCISTASGIVTLFVWLFSTQVTRGLIGIIGHVVMINLCGRISFQIVRSFGTGLWKFRQSCCRPKEFFKNLGLKWRKVINPKLLTCPWRLLV